MVADIEVRLQVYKAPTQLLVVLQLQKSFCLIFLFNLLVGFNVYLVVSFRILTLTFFVNKKVNRISICHIQSYFIKIVK